MSRSESQRKKPQDDRTDDTFAIFRIGFFLSNFAFSQIEQSKTKLICIKPCNVFIAQGATQVGPSGNLIPLSV